MALLGTFDQFTGNESASFNNAPGSVYRIEMVCVARKLHLRLFERRTTARKKAILARRISGLLFSAEANATPSSEARALFHRLRMHAHMVSISDPSVTKDPDSITRDYDTLGSIV